MANTSKRGFASMDAAKQREIASKGGKAAHAKGTAHEFTSDEARVAGRKGGEAVSRDRAHMSAIGREGGHSRGARARATQTPNTTTPTSTTTSNQSRTSSAPNQNFNRSAASEQRIGAGSSLETGRSGSDRSYAASDRERDRGDTPSNNAPYTGRDEI
jgi:general stress protein YciG